MSTRAPIVLDPLAGRGVHSPPIVAPQLAQSPAAPEGIVRDTVDGQRENVTRPIPLVILKEQPVYRTLRRWRGVDVFVDVPLDALADGDILSVFVYAVTSGVRVLVSSGRYRHTTSVTTDARERVWICAARCTAERFEITSSVTNLGTATRPQVVFTICASDQCLNPPPDVGVIPISPLSTSPAGVLSPGPALTIINNPAAATNGATFGQGLELVALNAVAIVAARFLNVYDWNGVGLFLTPPQLCFGLPAVGNTLYQELSAQQRQRYLAGVTLQASTNPTTGGNPGAGGDLFMQGWVK